MKKWTVFIPVLIVSFFYFKAKYYEDYAVAGLRGKASLAFGVLIMLGIMMVGIYRKKPDSFFQWFLISSFFVYIFMVLTLTGYFGLFREIAAHGWWQRVVHRFHVKERINLRPFLMFRQFRLFSEQILGNLVMLLPLGIYIPLLFPGNSGFFKVFFLCLLFSVSIELMQLITSYRSTDVDDVILNTSGAVVGYIIFKLVFAIFGYNREQLKSF
ncbi:MAG TPA: VanZ family protein [Chitinophagaceae bacterium]|nr:VanZ family protein [Chitinophagaceae bacterium]